jgi:UDP-GlcNAc:undecaprenyl-phosphate GlcNAc-1-phosphate transferase
MPAGDPGDLLRWLIAAVAFVVATAIARRIALAAGFVAHPNPIVRTHRAPIPYLGGAALVTTLALLVAAFALFAGAPPARATLARLAAALALCALGVWDDRRALGPGFKLLVQLGVCAAYLAIADGPLRPSLLLKLLALVTVINAYNLIDVMDGLLCLLAALPLVGLLAIPDLAAGPLRGEIAFGLIGLAALFLFNAPPARIYAGDGGSLPLGFLVGAWCLAAVDGLGPVATVGVAGLVAIPLLELSLLIVARLSQGLSPFRGSPDHFSLRLQDQARWSKWQVLAGSTAVGGWFALAPLAAARWGAAWAAVYALSSLVMAVVLWWSVWRIPPPRRSVAGVAPIPAAEPSPLRR